MKNIKWEIGELNECGGYDCMTDGIYVGNVLLDGREYGQKPCEDLTPDIKAAMLADARLIAAAPNLLEALHDMIRAHPVSSNIAQSDAITKAIAAIQKATGIEK